jgi:hypothetical protein
MRAGDLKGGLNAYVMRIDGKPRERGAAASCMALQRFMRYV